MINVSVRHFRTASIKTVDISNKVCSTLKHWRCGGIPCSFSRHSVKPMLAATLSGFIKILFGSINFIQSQEGKYKTCKDDKQS